MAHVRTRTGGLARFAALNTRWHRTALIAFLVIVLGHWAEHVAQAFQIYALGWPVHEARGLLGVAFPWLVHSEALHYGYALVMLIGLIVLRPGFTGSGRTWWTISLGVQVWHHFEHLLLLLQVVTGVHLSGRSAPTSIAQLVVPRVELHLFYNAIVFLPMIVGMMLHMFPSPVDRAAMRCGCALPAWRGIV
ncbi:hypothetical protein C8D88_102878 [Lentzea atacamensis]|uniref:Uncharacterized protein n=1 Tax=Lentzea atacamensis TaxID=531938 RepID=A0A316IAC3_9PSEU|nr:hypothetical protein [Lentzea atacamensis]PWK89603.1 hypothetical protein C8D88_102878 [Lentzea atacamensis]